MKRYHIKYQYLDQDGDLVTTREFRGQDVAEAHQRFHTLCVELAGLEESNIKILTIQEEAQPLCFTLPGGSTMNFADYNRAITNAADRLVTGKFNSTGELDCIRDFVQQQQLSIEAHARDIYSNLTPEFASEFYSGDTDAARARTQQLLELAVIRRCLDTDEYLLAAVAQ